MGLRIIGVALFAIWLVLVLAGKGGFVHLLLLNSVALAATELVTAYRSRLSR